MPGPTKLALAVARLAGCRPANGSPLRPAGQRILKNSTLPHAAPGQLVVAGFNNNMSLQQYAVLLRLTSH
jgi:hypothetical protein